MCVIQLLIREGESRDKNASVKKSYGVSSLVDFKWKEAFESALSSILKWKIIHFLCRDEIFRIHYRSLYIVYIDMRLLPSDDDIQKK